MKSLQNGRNRLAARAGTSKDMVMKNANPDAFAPGQKVLIRNNPHVASATHVVGRVVSFQPGAGFMGCDLAYVAFTDPATGEEHEFPFATDLLGHGDRAALIAAAERHERQAAELRRLAEASS